jgi:hypothetical protein
MAEADDETITAPALLPWSTPTITWDPITQSAEATLEGVGGLSTIGNIAGDAETKFEGAGELLAKRPSRYKLVEVFDDLKSRPGRPPEYNHSIFEGIAKDLISKGVDDYLDRFVERVRNELGARHIKAPGDTLLTEICAPIWKGAKLEK